MGFVPDQGFVKLEPMPVVALEHFTEGHSHSCQPFGESQISYMFPKLLPVWPRRPPQVTILSTKHFLGANLWITL